MSSKQKCALSMLSIHFCLTFNPSETIWLVSPSALTAPSYFTSSTSCELAVATNKIIHWLSYIGTAELQTKAQSTGLIYYWWTDVLAVCCAVNVETKQGTGLELVVLFRMFLAVSIKYLVWNNNHARSDHWCEVSWWWKTASRSIESNSEQNRLWWNKIWMEDYILIIVKMMLKPGCLLSAMWKANKGALSVAESMLWLVWG